MGENAEGAAKARKTGRLLGGRYRLGDVLGRGGMGTVWRAEDEILGRTVAVKELRFPSDIDEDEKRRLITRTLREAKAIARIRSGSAVTVFDVVDEDSRPWIVMELIEGRSLADVIKQDGPLSPRRAAEVGLAVLGVLRAAHREGIVHRDVKPSNVLIEDETDRVVLTDFGIAKVEGDPSVTSTGMLVGAPSYISPERARGQRPGPPADLWSLGGLLYASVEGHPPYDKGSAIATLTAVMTEALEPPEHAGELEEVIYGLLLKDPEKRLDEAGARALLQAVLDAEEEPAEAAAAKPADATVALAVPAAEAAPAGPSLTKTTAEPVPAAGEPAGAPAAAAPAGAFGGLLSSGGSGGGTGGAGRRRGPALVAVAVGVLLLGMLGAVLAFAFSGGDGGGGSSGKGENAAAAGGGGGDDGKGEDGTRGDGSGGEGGDGGPDGGEDTAGSGGGADEGGDTGGSGGDDEGGLPEGYAEITDEDFRFTMAMPESFSRVGIAGRNSGGIYAAERGTLPKLQVDHTSSPTGSALRAWQLIEQAVAAASTDYKKIRMETVEWRDYPTVSDWHFERQEHGERARVLNRGFKVDGNRGYAIVVTCKAAEWDGEECTTLRETAFDTFRPAK